MINRCAVRAIIFGLLSIAPLIGSAAYAANVNVAASFPDVIVAATAAMQSDPLVAAGLAHKAELLASGSSTPSRSIDIAKARWLQGEAAMRLNDVDRGELLIRDALRAVTKDANGSKLNGDLLVSLSQVESARGRPENALIAAQEAYEIFTRLKIARSQAVALQTIGSIYQDAADFDKVIYYYGLADDAISGDLSLGLSSANNLANAYRSLGRTKDAVREYKRALTFAERLGPVVKARVLGNLAEAQIAANDLFGAKQSINAGLVIASRPENQGWRAPILAIAANLALRQSRPEEASKLINLALKEDGVDQRSKPYRYMHLTAYRAYKALGDTRRALDHFETWWQLEDANRELAASTSARLMSAKFDFAVQNSRIATLRSGQLKRDVELTRLNARQQLIIFSALLILAASAIIFLFVHLRTINRSRKLLQSTNDALRRSNTELEHALVAKSLFLATTSHEIRTPLNGVLGMTQVILADSAVVGALRERMSLIDEAGKTMKALVDDILDLAKMDSGEYEVALGHVDIAALLAEVVRFWKTQAESKGLSIGLEGAASLPACIDSDSTRLRQVLFNLISNAIKFTHTGSIRIIAAVAVAKSTETLVIEIIDTGIGIPAVSFEAIFDKFHQLDQGTNRQYSGSGLGLAISRHIVRALGGDIKVSSIPGAGSTMRIEMPLRRVVEIADTNAAAVRHAARCLGDSWVVIAGANPITTSVLRASLKPHVAVVTSCPDVSKLFMAGGKSGDIILLDGDALRSTGGDPLQIGRRLEQVAREAGTAFFMLLTPDDGGDGAITPLATPSFLISRPISVDELVTRLKTVIFDEYRQYQIDEIVAENA